jgi:hypothetical protein
MNEKILHSESPLATLSRLEALRANLKSYQITEEFVKEYEDMLNCIEDYGIEMSKFRIPKDKLAHRLMGGISTRAGFKPDYSKERMVDNSFFFIKIDGAILFLNSLLKEQKREIGFKED